MLLEPLVPVPFVFLSIMGPTGYVRVNISASKAEFRKLTSRKMGVSDYIWFFTHPNRTFKTT